MARTKEFDPDAVLQKALELFWERGYEATSMADLVGHLGISAGIRINSISPGSIDTQMSLLPGETEAGRDERLKQALPAGRACTVGEAAAAVLWLAAPDVGFTVGHDLVIDGGAAA